MRLRPFLALALALVLLSGCLKQGGGKAKEQASADPQQTESKSPDGTAADNTKKDAGGTTEKKEADVPKVSGQEQAAAALTKLGARLEVDDKAPGKPILSVNLGGKEEVSDAHLALLKECTQLKELNLTYTQVTDKGLESIKGLTALEKLDLYHTKVTDAGLAQLAGLTQLKELGLDWTAVSDKGLETLKGFKQLQRLDLFRTKITDAGLPHLKALAQIKELDCGGTEITEKGLDNLKGLTKLEGLGIGTTKVTQEGADELQKALPKLKMRR